MPTIPSPCTDVEVLNFALTLEHLENAFYAEGLGKLNAESFGAAGFEPWVRARFVQIKEHEATHVDFLTKALGDQAVQPCTYNLYVYQYRYKSSTH